MSGKHYEVLATGLTPDWLSRAKERGIDTVGTHTQERVDASIEKFKAQVAEMQNVKISMFMIDADDTDVVQKWAAKLREKQWDAISFGGGVRQIPHVEELFEQLINTAKDNTKKECRFVFPLLPEFVVPALKRQIPDLK